MIEGIRQGLQEDGFEVPLTKLCRWFGIAQRSVYDKPSRATPKVNPAFVEPIKALIEEEPSFGYRTAAHLLWLNKSKVRRIFQLKG
jgi:putative transposase